MRLGSDSSAALGDVRECDVCRIGVGSVCRASLCIWLVSSCTRPAPGLP